MGLTLVDHAHQHLARTGNRIRHVLVVKLIDATITVQ
jgi:hypothetical protein